MSGSQPPETPLVIWGLGAGMALLTGIVGHLLRLIWRADATTVRIATEVKADFVRAQETHIEAMNAIREEFNARWNESNSDRMNIRIENREHHRENTARHDRLMERLAEIPTRSELFSIQSRHGAGDD